MTNAHFYIQTALLVVIDKVQFGDAPIQGVVGLVIAYPFEVSGMVELNEAQLGRYPVPFSSLDMVGMDRVQ